VQQQLCQLGTALLAEPLIRLAASKGSCHRHTSSRRAMGGHRQQGAQQNLRDLENLLPFAAVAVKAKCGLYWRLDDLQADIAAAAYQVRQVTHLCQANRLALGVGP
jgi:hypothetical protein